MSEVYSTGVAIDFSNQKVKTKKQKEPKPKMSRAEFEQKILEKIETVVTRDGGSYAEFSNGVGLLVAGAKQKGKFYFVWLDRDRKLQFTDTKDTYHLLSYHPDLSILDYLLKHERNTIFDIVDNFFKREADIDAYDKWELVGRINLGQKYINTDKKNNKDAKSKSKKRQRNRKKKTTTGQTQQQKQA